METTKATKRHTPRIDYAAIHRHEHGDPTWTCQECGMPVAFRWRKSVRKDVPVHLR